MAALCFGLEAALNRLLPQVSTAGRTVVIMSQIPNWFEDPIACVFALQTSLLRSHSFRQTCQNRISGFDKSYFQISGTYRRYDPVIQWSKWSGCLADG